MRFHRFPKTHSTLLACCLATAFATVHAADPDTADATPSPSTTVTTAPTATVGTSSNTEAKLSAEFAGFLGGQEQAASVVSGLRQGSAFSLDAAAGTADTAGTTTTPGTSTPSTTATTTIDPPTGTMGYGNVRITLRLAQAHLSKLGITEPTTEELSAVLLGGEINGTPVEGILALRADGMGWGQIAKEYGMTVGQIMGKGAGTTRQAAAPTALEPKTGGKVGSVSGSATQTGPASQARSNGYIPSSRSATAPQGRSNGYIPSGGGKAPGAGIVSAAGGSMGSAAHGSGKGQAHKITASNQGVGVVSAGGQSVSMSGVGSAGGGKAMAPGQAKKN